jgi:hypothetical protein
LARCRPKPCVSAAERCSSDGEAPPTLPVNFAMRAPSHPQALPPMHPSTRPGSHPRTHTSPPRAPRASGCATRARTRRCRDSAGAPPSTRSSSTPPPSSPSASSGATSSRSPSST